MGSSLTENAGHDLVRLGVLTRTFGLAGGLRCVLDTEAVPEIPLPAPARVGYSASFARELMLTRYERHGNDLVCFFDGVTDQSRAQELVDQAIFLPVDARKYDSPLSDPQLIGFEVIDEAGESKGVIDGIISTRAHYILVIRAGEREWMLPAVDEFVVELRSADRSVVVRTIPGLFEEDENGQAGD